VYYDLEEARAKSNPDNLAVIRIEQLHPYPEKPIAEVLRHYDGAREVVWLQEEPQNMGAWTFMNERLRRHLRDGQTLRYIGREAAASPATGSLKLHQRNQEQILEAAVGGNRGKQEVAENDEHRGSENTEGHREKKDIVEED
jgi:2-oxoglutarate dehydrogenase E1 component